MEARNIYHDDLVPGTVHLVQESHHGASTKHDIVLVPRPSLDRTDPLVSRQHLRICLSRY